MFLYAVMGVILLFAGVLARTGIMKYANANAVDQYYWQITAEAYRKQRGLPVSIINKYLMEDETQAYPPLFGMLLSILPKGKTRYFSNLIEIAQLGVLTVFLLMLGSNWEYILLAVGCYVAAPVLVVYNSQLTSRILGEFFLCIAMILQVVAMQSDLQEGFRWMYWGVSAGMIALVWMTHKMTLQLHLALLPFWWWALSAWQVLIAAVAGFCIFVLIVGSTFAVYQLKAHWDIVRFWNKNWRNLGAHQFRHSSVYGDEKADRSVCFHAPGLKGVLKHFRVVVAYAPMGVMLPLCSFLTGQWPPLWLIVWFYGIYVWTLLTLFVPFLKCLGGGHLYIFNLIVPLSIYLMYLSSSVMVVSLLVLGILMTLASLWFAYRIVKTRPVSRDGDFEEILCKLQHVPTSAIAVFPLQFAEAVAFHTKHAVLWGGHSYGFEKMSGFFPVLEKSLEHFIHDYAVKWILWDTHFWHEGKERMLHDGIINEETFFQKGRWCLCAVQ